MKRISFLLCVTLLISTNYSMGQDKAAQKMTWQKVTSGLYTGAHISSKTVGEFLKISTSAIGGLAIGFILSNYITEDNTPFYYISHGYRTTTEGTFPIRRKDLVKEPTEVLIVCASLVTAKYLYKLQTLLDSTYDRILARNKALCKAFKTSIAFQFPHQYRAAHRE
ncbi:MAG: hypothetical protein Q8Q25_03360 [bacterium]|nr:hypothetical protein [bacterium]